MIIKTKIHGKMYDLTNFNHPGGSIPLHLINGEDSTCMFETYHPVSNRNILKKTLAKYEIKDDHSIHEHRIYDFTDFETNPFVQLFSKVLCNTQINTQLKIKSPNILNIKKRWAMRILMNMEF